jgi:cullin 1
VSYEFQVTTLQAIALASFNGSHDAWMSFSEVQTRTMIDVPVLKKVLHSLACQKSKVLEKDTATNSIDQHSDKFRVNAEFQSKTRKLRIPMASLEESHNPERIEEDRSYAIEAAIVRIMKSRKILSHASLVNEVLIQLQAFKPQVKVIKKRIEHLIEREYLARDEQEQSNYKYLA